jgi:hypothetical protein
MVINFLLRSAYFSKYVTEFYGLKSSTINPGERYIYKLLLNGLYGYFGKIVTFDEFIIIGYMDIKVFNFLYNGGVIFNNNTPPSLATRPTNFSYGPPWG